MNNKYNDLSSKNNVILCKISDMIIPIDSEGIKRLVHSSIKDKSVDIQVLFSESNKYHYINNTKYDDSIYTNGVINEYTEYKVLDKFDIVIIIRRNNTNYNVSQIIIIIGKKISNRVDYSHKILEYLQPEVLRLLI